MTVAEPVTDPKLACMFAVPIPAVCAEPTPELTTAAGFDELQLAMVVRSRTVPSGKTL